MSFASPCTATDSSGSAAAVPHMRIGDPAFNAERTLGAGPAGVGGAGGARDLPRARASRATRSRTCSTRRRCSTRSSRRCRAGCRRERVAVARDRRRRAAAVRARGVQHRGRDPPRPRSRRRSQELSARVPRVLREAPVPRRPRRGRRPDPAVRLGSRQVPFGPDLLFAASDLPAFVLHVEICEDLWVPIPPSTYGALAGATVLANLSASNITDRQGRLPPGAVRVAVGPDDRRLPVHGRRHGRVDDRSRLGRPGADLRERRPARRGRAVRDRRAADHRRRRSRPDRRPTAPAPRATATRSTTTAGACRACGGSRVDLGFEGSGGAVVPLRRRVERFPYVPAESRQPQRALRGGLQHPGARARNAPARRPGSRRS